MNALKDALRKGPISVTLTLSLYDFNSIIEASGSVESLEMNVYLPHPTTFPTTFHANFLKHPENEAAFRLLFINAVAGVAAEFWRKIHAPKPVSKQLTLLD